jgi:gluconate 2-dehydrogenase gamma chain
MTALSGDGLPERWLAATVVVGLSRFLRPGVCTGKTRVLLPYSLSRVILRLMRRRHFLTISAASLGGALVSSVDDKLPRLNATEQNDKPIRVPLHFFTETEALIVSAAVSHIFPADDFGPGAAEAGVTIYIDRQLAGPWGRDRHRYTQPPFDDEAAAAFGYQGRATPREIYREGLKILCNFHLLTPEEQEAILHQIESTRFFYLLRRNTIEGLFSDPLHGGNVGMIGWQVLGFPGPRMNNADDIEKHYGEAFRPKPASLQEVTGAAPSHSSERPGATNEDEP